MTLWQFAKHNVLRDTETYIAYWLSSVFTVTIFFIFAVNADHPELDQDDSSIQLFMRMASVIVLVFAVMFLSLSIYSFVDRRRRTFGTLRAMGMSRRQLRRMLLAENSLIGASAIVVGMLVGTAFGHLSVLIMARIVRLSNITWKTPLAPIRDTAIGFAVVFVLVTLLLVRGLSRRPILELLSSPGHEAKGVRFSGPLAVVGAVVLLLGYALTFYPRCAGTAPALIDHVLEKTLNYVLIGCFMVGTFLILSQFAFLAITGIQKHSRRYLRGGNALWVSGLLYRLKSGVTSMFISTMLLTAAFCAITASISLAMSVRADITASIPFAATYYAFGDSDREAGDLALIERELDGNGIDHQQYTLDFILLGEGDDVGLVDTKFVSEEEYGRVTGEHPDLAAGQALDISGASETTGSTVGVDGVGELEVVGAGTRLLDNPRNIDCYVVADQTLQEISQQPRTTSMRAHLFDFDDALHDSGARAFSTTVRNTIGVGMADGESFLFIPRIDEIDADEFSHQIFTYVGVLFSAVFMAASASLIYFRLVSSVRDNLPITRNLHRMGMSLREILRVQRRQLLVLFTVPVLLAVVNTGFAMNYLVMARIASRLLYGRFLIILIPLLALQAGYFAFLSSRFSAKVRIFLKDPQ